MLYTQSGSVIEYNSIVQSNNQQFILIAIIVIVIVVIVAVVAAIVLCSRKEKAEGAETRAMIIVFVIPLFSLCITTPFRLLYFQISTPFP